MVNFSFMSPTEFVFGRETELNTGMLVKKYGGSKALIVYGGGSAIKSGLMDKVEKSLLAAGISYACLGGVKPNPRSDLVYEGIALVRRERADFLLAVGGGSVIDTAKAIAAGALYDGDFWDFYEKKAAVEKALPIGCVLTIAAAGSEGSSSSVITKVEGMLKRGHRSDLFRPKFSVMNPEYTYSLPPYQKASGAVDMMAHVLERYFTNEKGNDLTDRLCEAVLSSVIRAIPIALENPTDYDAHAQLMWAGTLAHNDTCGNGRVADWGAHGMEHELSAKYDVAHGAGLAVVFPAWMRYQMAHDVMLFAQLAHRVWGIDMDFSNPARTASLGIDACEAFFQKIGMSTTLKELNVPWEDIPELAASVAYHRPDELGNFRPLHREDVEKVFRLAYDRRA